MPTLRIPGALRALTGGVSDVDVTAATVRTAIAELDRLHPGIAAKVLANDAVKPFIRIYVGPEDINSLAGLDTAVGERDEISIVPAIAGGATGAQSNRYARHIQLPDIGVAGQDAILSAAARMPVCERDPQTVLIAATYLVAGGVGTLAMPSETEAERATLAIRGPDTRVVVDGSGASFRDVELEPPPSWWPRADRDVTALAFYRGGLAATRWLAAAAKR